MSLWRCWPSCSSSASGRFTWPTLAKRIESAGLSPQQVQVVWLKHVEANPKPLGEFPARARADGLHPNEAGSRKTTTLLLNFFKTDAGASRWFLKPGAEAQVAPLPK